MAKKFLERMVRVYGPPTETKDVTGFLTEYQNALEGFSDETLMRAADRIFRDRKYKSWPSIAECLDAANGAVKVEKATSSAPTRPATPMFILKRDVDRLQWPAWMSAISDKDREHAEQTGVIVVTARWPENGQLLKVGNDRTYTEMVSEAASR